MRVSVRLVLGALALLLAGCGVAIPADPDHTLDRVRGGTLRVGVSPNPPWTDVSGQQPAGSEVELARAFAAALGAQPTFEVGGEEPLVARMEHGELDLIVGGLTDQTPWSKQVAVTRPYATAIGPTQRTERHVLAVPLGENAFLVELERFIHARTGE